MAQVLVIGSGISGLWTALRLADKLPVTLVTKGGLMDSNTRYAQGGIAAAIAPDDDPDLHWKDTLAAGAGLCEPEAVRVLTEEGPDQVRALMQAGVRFDLTPAGDLATTLEAAHSRRRVIHARGDATGYEIERALVDQVRDHSQIIVKEHIFVLDLLVQEGRCRGAVLLGDSVEFAPADAVVLAAGGMGQVWKHTTNPPTATGDGIALAYRAGAEIMDMEFMQFHPTSFVPPGGLQGGTAFLVSEAVRGEGAILRNAAGEAFMERYHPDKELAPRDVVARAIAQEMANDGRDFVWLDLRHLSEAFVRERFPTILRVLSEHGVNIPADMIPVAPAAHYFIGGARTDLHARTTVPGLYAVGEVSCTGVHGANRLASNSLLEAAVFGHRAAIAVQEDLESAEPLRATALYPERSANPERFVRLREQMRALMWERVGLLRDREGLDEAIAQLEPWLEEAERASLDLSDQGLWELRNMLQVGLLTARAARWREESRGTHFRLDFPERDDSQWLKHFVQQQQTIEPSTPSSSIRS